MLLKRVIAYIVDYALVNFIVIMLGIIIHLLNLSNVDYRNIVFAKFTVLFYNYNVGLISITSFLLLIFLNFGIAIVNNGKTIGDGILGINIVSRKYEKYGFYFLRFFFRTLSLYFFHIFLIINFISIIVKKKSIIWYDDLLGVICNDMKNY